jgi:hypothetical protein
MHGFARFEGRVQIKKFPKLTELLFFGFAGNSKSQSITAYGPSVANETSIGFAINA